MRYTNNITQCINSNNYFNLYYSILTVSFRYKLLWNGQYKYETKNVLFLDICLQN